MNNLAEVYLDEGKPADAEPGFQRALAVAEKSLGPNHPQVAAVLIGLASAYEDENKYADAELLFKRALSIDQVALGSDHPSTGEAQMNLAVFYYGWGKPELAAPYFDSRLGNLMDQFKANAEYMSEKDRLTFLGTVPGAFPLFLQLRSEVSRQRSWAGGQGLRRVAAGEGLHRVKRSRSARTDISKR